MKTPNEINMNAIVWSTDLTKAQEIAEKFTNGPTGQGMMYVKGSKEYSLRTFVRTPVAYGIQPINGIVDIIILHVESAESDELKEAKKYVDSRKTIPIKILCSENPLVDEAASLDCKYVNISELLGEGRETVIKEAKKFEETLINCFKKFDINGNGLISVDELVKVSEELGHHLELDDAKMIVTSLDENKWYSNSIDFNNFKKWWVMGKSDFHAFRRICKAEMSINNLVKLTSKKFNSYLENLKNESYKVSQEEILQSLDFNVHSKQEFENGFGLFLELCSGPEAKEAISCFPETMRNSPLGLSVRVPFREESHAKEASEVFQALAASMLAENPLIKPYLEMGVQYTFRTEANVLVLDLMLSGFAAELATTQAQEFPNLKNLDVSGNLTFHLFSSLVLNDLLSGDYNFFELVEKFFHLKFHLNTKSFGLRQLWSQLNEQLKISFGEIPGFKKIIMLINSLLMLRKFNLDLSFDAVEGKDLFAKIIARDEMHRHDNDFEKTLKHLLEGGAKPDEKFKEMRAEYNQLQEQAESLRAMIPQEILNVVGPLQADKLECEVFVNLPNATLLLKNKLNLPGLNSVKDSFLN